MNSFQTNQRNARDHASFHLERAMAPGELLMDGIFVDHGARGMGVGTALLTAIKAEAQSRGCSSARLDVIDTTPRALYERVGLSRVKPIPWACSGRYSASRRRQRWSAVCDAAKYLIAAAQRIDILTKFHENILKRNYIARVIH